MPELLTVTQAAALLGTSRSQIHALIEQGKLKPFTLPGDAQRPYGKAVIYLDGDEVEKLRGTWTPRRPKPAR